MHNLVEALGRASYRGVGSFVFYESMLKALGREAGVLHEGVDVNHYQRHWVRRRLACRKAVWGPAVCLCIQA